MTKEDYFKYYIQGSDHYLIPKDVFKELFNEMSNWREESQKQKEVINKAINNSQYWIDYYTRLNSDERIALRLQENIDILKEIKNENKDTRI